MMKVEKLGNGKVRLSAPSGVIDTRNGEWYSEAIVKEENVKFLQEKTDEMVK